LNALNPVGRTEHIFDDALLRAVQMRMLVCDVNGVGPGRHWLKLILPFPDTPKNLPLGFNGPGRSELASRRVLAIDDLKLAGRKTRCEIAAHLSIGYLAHAAAERIADDCPLIHDGFALEVLVAGKGHGLTNALLRVRLSGWVLGPFVGCAHHGIGLVAVLGGKLAMCGHDLAG